MTWIFLSHALGVDTPSYGGGFPLQISQVRSIEGGDTCNECVVSMPLHLGTHVDAPRHFDPRGATIDEYEADFWHATRVSLIEIPAEPGAVLSLKDAESLIEDVPLDCEMLLVRTGFESFRVSDIESYASRGPCMGEDFARWIRLHPSLKFVGIDAISVSSWMNRETGRRAHAELLSGSLNPAVLVVEDMHLAELRSPPMEVWVQPLRLAGTDGAPATVIARVE